MRQALLLFILLCCLHPLYSQTDFREAYVITIEGDTLTGFVNYNKGSLNFKVCDFRKTIETEIISYKPDQIAAYRFINDIFFKSEDIIINKSSERVFIKVLVKGKSTLFNYINRFFVSKDTLFYELKNERKEVVVNGKNGFKNTNEHIGILSYLLSDCIGLRSKIHDVRLSEKELTRLIEKYNKCSGEPTITYIAIKPWFKFNTRLGIALTSTSIKLSSNIRGTDYLTGNYEKDNTLAFGVNFEFSSPRIDDRLYLCTGVFYLQSEYKSYYTDEIPPIYFEQNEISINLNQLKIPVGLKYVFPANKMGRAFLNFGISFNQNLNSSIYLRKESVFLNVANAPEIVNDVMNFKKNQMGYWSGLGVSRQINKRAGFYLEMRYEQSKTVGEGITNRYINKVKIVSEIQNIQMLIGVSF